MKTKTFILALVAFVAAGCSGDAPDKYETTLKSP